MDKFGYYFAGGIKTYSKLEACQIGGATFHFNDEVYSSIDTRKEPNDSLWQLYMARAKQIRQTYDYIVIMYSGGSDSNNVLDAFIAADCKFEELCTTWDYETTALSQSFHNAEAINVVLPRIKQLKQQRHDFRFRTVDLPPLIMQAFHKLGNNFEFFVNHHMSPNNVAKHFLRENVKEWREIIASGKKLCLVWGGEKPMVFQKNNRWYFHFCDMLDNCVGPYTFKPGWYDEMFYWTPDLPQIVIKQAHMVKQASLRKKERLTYDELKCVIYPTWDPATFCNGKATSMIYSQRDNFFFEGNVNVARYHQIVESYYKQIGDTTPKEKRVTIPSMCTRLYEI